MKHLMWVLLLLLLSGCRGVPAAPEASETGAEAWTLETPGDTTVWLAPDWLRARGVDVSAPLNFRLTWRGDAVPVLPIEQKGGWGALFFAPAERSRYTPRSTFHLQINAEGARLSEDQVEPSAASPAPVRVTLTREQDLRYLPQATAPTPWVWQSLYAPHALTQTVTLTDAVGGAVTASVQLWSHTDSDHRALLRWDGDVVGEWAWEGQGMQTLTATWTLREPAGAHALTLETPSVAEDRVAVVWLDRWALTYPRAGAALGLLTATGSAFTVPPEAHVVDVTASTSPTLVPTTETQASVIPGHRYWVGTLEDAAEPLAWRPRESLDVDALAAVDYLAVAPAPFHAAVQPLLDYREAQGLTPALVTPQAVYDHSGAGRPDPEAIRSLVRALPALRYLLLVGDATTEREGYVGEAGALRIVTPFTRTRVLGETPADAWLGADGHGQPQVAVGRIPAATPADVRAVVEKTQRWESQAASQPLLLHDDEAEFRALVTDLAPLLPDPSPPVLDAGAPDARSAALAALDSPTWLIYNGHGSLRQLGDEGVLTLEDGATWQAPALVNMWTCLSAHFTHPQQPSLAEAWLAAPDAGAVAFLGPVGETLTAEQRPFAQSFYRALDEHPRLGDAWLAALRQTAGGAPDVRWGFVLLGDPALHVQPVQP